MLRAHICKIGLTINAVAVELKASVVKDEVDTASSLLSRTLNDFPELLHMVTEDVAFRGC